MRKGCPTIHVQFWDGYRCSELISSLENDWKNMREDVTKKQTDKRRQMRGAYQFWHEIKSFLPIRDNSKFQQNCCLPGPGNPEQT